MVVVGVIKVGVEIVGLDEAQGEAWADVEVNPAASLEGKSVGRAGTAGCGAPIPVSAADEGLGEGRQAGVFAVGEARTE